MAAERANHAAPEQIQIPDRVEDFVLHELIAIPQAVFVENLRFPHHDGVIDTAAERQIALPHHFQIAHEAESARTRDFLHERGG